MKGLGLRGKVQIFAHFVASGQRSIRKINREFLYLEKVSRLRRSEVFSATHPALPGWANFCSAPPALVLGRGKMPGAEATTAFHIKAKRRQAAALQSRAEALHYRKDNGPRWGGELGLRTGGFGGWTGRRYRGRRRPDGRGLRGSRGYGGDHAWPGGSGPWGGGRLV